MKANGDVLLKRNGKCIVDHLPQLCVGVVK